MNIQELIAKPPLLHLREGRLSSSWKLDDRDILFLDEYLTENMKTLETGAGLSTVLFALKGTNHTCIAPDELLFERIKEYCNQYNINHSKITFLAETSEYALPLIKDNDFDVALIYGRHGFPAPFIDWFYLSNCLKEGGILIIDDVNIWTCELLMNFLFTEKDWEILQETNRTAIFIKRGNSSQYEEYTNQPFVLSRSRQTSTWPKVKYLLNLLKERKFSLFTDIVFKKMR